MRHGYLPYGLKMSRLALLLLAAGCSANIEAPPVPTATQLQASLSPSASLETPATATAGAMPTHQVPTLSPAPTLSPDEARDLVRDLLATNAGCRLPCWWGLTPGETTWGIAERFLSSFAAMNLRGDFPRHFVVDIFVPALGDEGIYPWQDYRFRDAILESIKTDDPGPSPTFAFVEFARSYGPPEEVWLRTYSEGVREDPPSFELALFYPDQGIASAFSLEGAALGDTVRGCPQQAHRPFLGLWSPELNVTFNEAADMFGWDREEWAFLPLAEATGMDVEAFYEAFSEPNNTSCLETRADLWTPQY